MDNMLFLNTVAQQTSCSYILINGFSLASKWFSADWKYWHQLIPSSVISQQGDTQESKSIYLCPSLLLCKTVTSIGKHFATYIGKVQHRIPCKWVFLIQRGLEKRSSLAKKTNWLAIDWG